MDHEARMQFVEEFGQIFVVGTSSRTAGRILGFLLTDDQPHRSLQELAEGLDVSKASVSTNTRVLIDQRMIRRVPVQGTRMEHYGLIPGGVFVALRFAADASREVAALLGRGQDLFSGEVNPGVVAMRDLEDGYLRLAGAIDQIVAEKLGIAQ